MLVFAMGSVHPAQPSSCILGDLQGAGAQADGLQDNLWVWCELECQTLARAGTARQEGQARGCCAEQGPAAPPEWRQDSAPHISLVLVHGLP